MSAPERSVRSAHRRCTDTLDNVAAQRTIQRRIPTSSMQYSHPRETRIRGQYGRVEEEFKLREAKTLPYFCRSAKTRGARRLASLNNYLGCVMDRVSLELRSLWAR